MSEIRELDITRALRQIESARYDQMLWQSELLQSNGVKVFEEGKGKGLSRYKDFFESFEAVAAERSRDKIKPAVIDPVNRFMEG